MKILLSSCRKMSKNYLYYLLYIIFRFRANIYYLFSLNKFYLKTLKKCAPKTKKNLIITYHP